MDTQPQPPPGVKLKCLVSSSKLVSKAVASYDQSGLRSLSLDPYVPYRVREPRDRPPAALVTTWDWLAKRPQEGRFEGRTKRERTPRGKMHSAATTASASQARLHSLSLRAVQGVGAAGCTAGGVGGDLGLVGNRPQEGRLRGRLEGRLGPKG